MLRRFLLLTFVFFIVIAAMPAVVAQAECDFSFSNYARAVQLRDMGDYDSALQHFHCALQEDPDDAIIPILIENVHEDIANAASAWSRDRDRDAAIAVACDPAQDHALLGMEAHEAGDDNLALIHLHCVLLSDPTHVDALYLTGAIYFSRGETRDAKYYIDRADRAAAARAEDEDLLVYLLGGDARSALKQVDLDSLTLTSPDPGETDEYFPPGQAFLSTSFNQVWARRHGNDAGARPPAQVTSRESIIQLERALAQAPTRADLRCELGRLYLAGEDYGAAYKHFTDLITETLGDHCSGADLDTAAKTDAPPAIAEWERALERDPTRVDLRCELGQLYYARGDFAAAYSHFSYLTRETLGDYCGS
ncbi:MAG: tetratricopeptide repeat protein [Chloroflexi bacterium]|nr:tetratricopeptide repeat protein [Chloroflexota bacterium]